MALLHQLFLVLIPICSFSMVSSTAAPSSIITTSTTVTTAPCSTTASTSILTTHPSASIHLFPSREMENQTTGATGILLMGGFPSTSASSASVEFWSTADPEEESCVLADYPRAMREGPTANLVSGQLV